MTRVDVMLALQKGKGTRYECLVPDEVASTRNSVDITIAGERRTATIIAVYSPLIEYKYDDKGLCLVPK
jgi:hypothetical protein